jgi:hypothetical protein
MSNPFIPPALASALTNLREAEDRVYAAVQADFPLGTLVKGRGGIRQIGRVVGYTEAEKPGVIIKVATDGTEVFVHARWLKKYTVNATQLVPSIDGVSLPRSTKKLIIRPERQHDQALA